MCSTAAPSSPEQLAAQWRHLPAHVVGKLASGPHQDADRADLVGAGFEGLWRAALAFDPARGLKFSSLAWRCVANCVLAELDRQRRPRPGQLVEEPPAAEAEDGGDAEAARKVVGVLLLVLRRRERAVVTRRFLAGESAAEVGAALGIGPARVRQVEAEALERMRRAVRIAGRPAARTSAR
jgi:RNA polymerase sigma factor (sigma-70 family)